jgi:hypothetical protein
MMLTYCEGAGFVGLMKEKEDGEAPVQISPARQLRSSIYSLQRGKSKNC